MKQPAFYDNTISYDENYKKGPPIDFLNHPPKQRNIKQKQNFLGFEINVPFGIPPGPLLNSKFIHSAFSYGFDVLGYKTVRSQPFPCHEFPNVVFVDTKDDLHPGEDKTLQVINHMNDENKYSITNSFGVPSKDPTVWQEDVRKALSYQGDGQLLILSFMGTVKENQTQEQFIEDFVVAAKLASETGAKVLEANLSCPNIGNEGLVCYNLDVTEAIVEGIRVALGEIPLILKVGYYDKDEDLERLSAITNTYANGLAFVNAIQSKVVDETGAQALPGANRQMAGIAGSAIKWAGLEMTKKLNAIRFKNLYKFQLISMGGVITPEDFKEYKDAGADVIQSATGAMWNPDLAFDIWQKYYSQL